MVLVGLGADEKTKRMALFLSESDLDISLTTFHGFKKGEDVFSDFSRLISFPLYRGDLGTRFRTHTGFLPQFARLDFPTMKLD
jgi:hypothetical protein